MAPEQADGLRPGPAADVYSLALTLYECFCGEHPLSARVPRPPPARSESRSPARRHPARAARGVDRGDRRRLDPDPEVRPLASELEAVLAAHVNELDGEPLPAIEGPDGEPAWPRRLPGSRGSCPPPGSPRSASRP